MEFRSTNDNGYTHIKGDLVTNVSSGGPINSSHGVHLSGGSTGGIVTAAGDETNIGLTIRPKGSGSLRLTGATGSTMSLGGGSTGQITLGSSGSTVLIAGSTAPFSGFLRFEDTAGATPALFNDTQIRTAETTHAIAALSSQTAGAPPTYYILGWSQNLPAGVTIAQTFTGSTAGDVHCRMVKGSTVAVASATCTIEFLVFRM